MASSLIKTPLDIVLCILFILYIIFPVQFPKPVDEFLISPFGLLFVLTLIFVFFIYGSVIVGVLFIFVAFLMVHRITKRDSIYSNSPPPPFTNQRRDREMQLMNAPIKEITLEEEIVVKTITPIRSNSMEDFLESSFKPVYCDSKTDYSNY